VAPALCFSRKAWKWGPLDKAAPVVASPARRSFSSPSAVRADARFAGKLSKSSSAESASIANRDASGFPNAKMGAISVRAHMAMETHCITSANKTRKRTDTANAEKTCSPNAPLATRHKIQMFIICNQAKRIVSERIPMCSALAHQPHRLRASNFKAIRIQTYNETEYQCQLWDLDGPPTYEYSRAKQATDAKIAWPTRPYRPSC